MRNGRLLPALSYDGQIFQVFQQFFVICDWKNDRCAFAAIIRDIFNRISHGTKINGNGSYPQWLLAIIPWAVPRR